ncbi:MAG: asparagine synthase (glutamine-hydrolyzing) [Isosphaeraceae bacterium]
MCGICVYIDDQRDVTEPSVRLLCDRIIHRGPDSEGITVFDGVGLGMRRLNIIDLEGGRQPIFNEDGSIAIVFNGEIYNFQELRRDLVNKGHRFKTSSDTEVILHLYEEEGEKAVERLRGMFAFAIHDRTTGRVFAARDRMGIKPLYYLEKGSKLYLVSELKSLQALEGQSLTLDEVALDQYFSLLYIPAPRTIYREVRKLPPGHVLIKDPGRPARLRQYWRLESRPFPGRSEGDWIEEFRARFDDAVASHLVADVPLGVFLSGGVDSSGIVAAMAKSATGPIKTFSIGFPREYAEFDERSYARQVARQYGTEHVELEAEPRIGDLIHELGAIFDEPIGDSGAVPNLLVCRLARQRLTVALSGLGGDELCGGYQRYLGVLVSEWYRRVPRVLRNSLARSIEMIPESRRGRREIDRAKRFVRAVDLPWIERFFAYSSPIERDRREALYSPDLRVRVELDSAFERMRGLADAQPEADLLNRLLAVDQQTYLVDDLLTVADRTSMGVSLELRVPFLDHPLVEFMAQVPGRFKIKGNRKKHLLKQAFAADLPRGLLNRRKSGFSIPVARWLREDLRALLEDYLSAERLTRQGYFDPVVVESLKREHFEGRRNHSSILWGLLMFQIWAKNYGPQGA